jgi:hypothetical protein
MLCGIYKKIVLTDKTDIEFRRGRLERRDPRTHIALIEKKGEYGNLEEDLKEANIQIVTYEKHKDWIDWFDQLRQPPKSPFAAEDLTNDNVF